jgi:hypothetical protein
MWIKSSDTDLTDRRLLEAGPLGRDLYHRAQLWMSSPANLTNGYISRRALRSLDDFHGITEDGMARLWYSIPRPPVHWRKTDSTPRWRTL